jgi:hypothetical protein
MKRFLSPWLIAAFLVSVLAVGIPYWKIPYSKVSLPNTLMTGALLVVVLAAALARFVGRNGFVATLLAVAASVPLVVIARVTVETGRDPTSHNLWPFEIVIAAGVGLLASAAGVVLGSIPAVLSRGGGPS